jgi:hypothetical protein
MDLVLLIDGAPAAPLNSQAHDWVMEEALGAN